MTSESEQIYLEPCIKIPIDNKILIELINKSKDWAIMHGVAMRSKSNFNLDSVNHAPFALLPSPFSRKEFLKAVQLQTILNELMHWVAHDEKFLRSTLESTVQVDEFTSNLFKVYDFALEKRTSQQFSLGLIRSDLMLERKCPSGITSKAKAYCCWKQVEINTIASGFGHLGPISKDLHSYVLQELDEANKLKGLPKNDALPNICKGMIKAWELVGNPKGVILFVIEEISYNICDQRFHEFEIRLLNPNIKVIRKTLTDIYNEGKINGNDLIVDGNCVSVVYFRAGYEPGHYPTEKEWDARKLIEISSAIKCPTIQYHLAGTKKVQQALAAPGVLQKFLNDPKKIKAVQEIFTGLYSLDLNESGQSALEMALKEPERFVLKPQREGGGNNVYGKDVKSALEKMPAEERSAWILMDRIQPPLVKGYVIRAGEPVPPPLTDLVSELGIFGVIIGNKDEIIANYQAGHMLRTKLSTADEAGVAAGQGALDSPYLID